MFASTWIERLNNTQFPLQAELEKPPQNPRRKHVGGWSDELAYVDKESVKFQVLDDMRLVSVMCRTERNVRTYSDRHIEQSER